MTSGPLSISLIPEVPMLKRGPKHMIRKGRHSMLPRHSNGFVVPIFVLLFLTMSCASGSGRLEADADTVMPGFEQKQDVTKVAAGEATPQSLDSDSSDSDSAELQATDKPEKIETAEKDEAPLIPEEMLQEPGPDINSADQSSPPTDDPYVIKKLPEEIAEEQSETLAQLDPETGTAWEKNEIIEEYGNGYTKIVIKDILSNDGYYYSFLEDPARMIVDFLNPQQQPSLDKLTLKGDTFLRLRTGNYPDKSRFVFDYRNKHLPPEPLIRSESGKLIILSGVSPEAPPAVIGPMGGPEPPVANNNAGWEPVRVKGIDFLQTDTSSDVIIILDSKAPYDVQKHDKDILLVLSGALIPEHLQRPIDTQAFPSAIRSITPKQVGHGPAGQVKILVDLREARHYNVVEDPKGIRLSVQLPEQTPEMPLLPAPDVPGAPQATDVSLQEQKQTPEIPVTPAALPKEKLQFKKPEKYTAQSTDRPQQDVKTKKKPAALRPLKKNYKGKKISLDFKDADIQNILRLLAEVSGQNIVISDAVKGKATIRLLNVPWDQAMEVVLKTYALDKEDLAQNIIRVAPYAQLEQERAAALSAEKALERVEELVTEIVPVNYAKAKTLLSMVNALKSHRTDANILMDNRTNTIVLKDLAHNVTEMANLIRHLDTPTPQVLIEAKIVELDIDFERELGIQWGTLYNAGPSTGNPLGLNFPNQVAIGGGQAGVAGIANPMVNLPAAVDASAGGALGLSLASLTNAFRLDMKLSALEKKNHARILSSPRVATLNNETARIEQGREIPYQTVSDEGTKTEFKAAKLKLSVTPQVNFNRSIIMRIVVTNDTPIKDPLVGYIIGKKEAKTTVQVGDSETAVIGGIYTSNEGSTLGGLPWFQDIPGIGTMFRKKGKTKKRTELVIFITPRIIPISQIGAQDWVKEKVSK